MGAHLPTTRLQNGPSSRGRYTFAYEAVGSSVTFSGEPHVGTVVVSVDEDSCRQRP